MELTARAQYNLGGNILVDTVRLLGICGSPRKTGNSRFLLDRAVAAAKETAPEAVETELYSFAGKEIAPCISCFRCMDAGVTI